MERGACDVLCFAEADGSSKATLVPRDAKMNIYSAKPLFLGM